MQVETLEIRMKQIVEEIVWRYLWVLALWRKGITTFKTPVSRQKTHGQVFHDVLAPGETTFLGHKPRLVIWPTARMAAK